MGNPSDGTTYDPPPDTGRVKPQVSGLPDLETEMGIPASGITGALLPRII
jgi:hypothetical protein